MHSTNNRKPARHFNRQMIELLESRQLLSVASTTALSETTNVITYGQSNTFTATVATVAGEPTPTGSIEFYAYNGTYPSSTVALSTTGTAALTQVGNIAGYMAFIAKYSGDENYAASDSLAVFSAVNQSAIVPVVSGNTIPKSLLTNAKSKDKVTVVLNNPTSSSITSYQAVNVYALRYLGGSFASTEIGSVLKKYTIPADSGKSVVVTVNPQLVDATDGSYSILSTVTNEDHLTSYSSSTTPADLNVDFAVAPPSVDLSATVSVVSPASHQILPGKTAGYSLEIFNIGNNLAAGSTQVAISTSLNADGSSPIYIGTLNEKIHIAAGGHQIIHINQKVPVGYTPGTYYFVSDVDPLHTFSETNVTNNVAVSAATLTVLDPYPNILGGYTGTWTIKSGRDKGQTITQTGSYSFESDLNGGFLVSGTNYFANGTTAAVSAEGTVSTTGVYLIPGSIVSKGKVAGGHIKGTFVFNDGSDDAGTFDWTLTG